MTQWKKVASALQLQSGGGTTKAWPLAVQDWGLHVKDVVYVIFVLSRSSANAKVGAEHREGPIADSTFFINYGNGVIAVGTVASVPIMLRGATNSAVNGPLLPYFTPTILVGDAGGQESVTVDVWVGGKPY